MSYFDRIETRVRYSYETPDSTIEVMKFPVTDAVGYTLYYVRKSPVTTRLRCIECIGGRCPVSHDEYDVHEYRMLRGIGPGKNRYEIRHELSNPVSGFHDGALIAKGMMLPAAIDWIENYITNAGVVLP